MATLGASDFADSLSAVFALITAFDSGLNSPRWFSVTHRRVYTMSVTTFSVIMVVRQTNSVLFSVDTILIYCNELKHGRSSSDVNYTLGRLID